MRTYGPKAMRTIQYNLRFSPKDMQRLDYLVKKLEVTRAQVIRTLLKQAVPSI